MRGKRIYCVGDDDAMTDFVRADSVASRDTTAIAAIVAEGACEEIVTYLDVLGLQQLIDDLQAIQRGL